MRGSKYFRGLLVQMLKGRRVRTKNGRGTVVFKVDRIGDFILATGAIRTLRKLQEGTPMTLVVSDLVKELAREEFPDVNIVSVKPFEGGVMSMALPLFFTARLKLRRHAATDLICLRHQRHAAHDVLMSWIPRDKSWGVENASPLLGGEAAVAATSPFDVTVGVRSLARSGGCGELDRHYALLHAFANGDVERRCVTPSLTCAVGGGGTEILVCPFTSSRMKDYPVRQFAEALDAVERLTGMSIALCGSFDQHARLKDLRALIVARRKIDVRIVLPRSIIEFVRHVRDAVAVISTDTAGAHIAAAMDKPMVGIVGGGHYGEFAPWQRSQRQRWVNMQLPCYNCNWQCIRKEVECITKILPNTIASELILALNFRA